MPAPSAVLVTTLRHAGPSLDSFIAWHLGQGFSHLFLFFDDPADPDLSRVANNPAITAIPNDAALRAAWEKLPEWASFGAFIASEVMARQVLNAALAMELARARGFSWLLHIDADELFFAPNGQSAADHFGLAEAEPADAIKYWNYEAVPEEDDIADPFRSVSLFKVPPAIKPGQNRFHFYANGKSAVRLSAHRMRPRSVHDFDDPDAPAATAPSTTHFILHYACCGFDALWNKYALLGNFADRWFGKTDIAATTGSSLHLEARDMVATGDREKARTFYQNRIAIQDKTKAETLIREGWLTRFQRPRKFLTEP